MNPSKPFRPFAIFCMLMGCFLFVWGFVELRTTFKIDKKRGFSMGIVDEIEARKDENTEYYRYEVRFLDSSGYHYFIYKNINVDAKQLRMNDSLGVYYFIDNPYKAYFANDVESHYGFLSLFAVGLVVILIGVFLFFYTPAQ